MKKQQAKQPSNRVTEIVDFSAVRVVVDVAGGNGELLGQILRAAPHLRGVLLERPHVIDAARATLVKASCTDRCQFVAHPSRWPGTSA